MCHSLSANFRNFSMILYLLMIMLQVCRCKTKCFLYQWCHYLLSVFCSTKIPSAHITLLSTADLLQHAWRYYKYSEFTSNVDLNGHKKCTTYSDLSTLESKSVCSLLPGMKDSALKNIRFSNILSANASFFKQRPLTDIPRIFGKPKFLIKI